LPNPDGAGYLLAHASGVVLLDAAGVERKTVPWNASTGEFMREIREVSA
jgi:cytochrome oxidase Cu insertion factor (SCO1/SenC/PrrC family)